MKLMDNVAIVRGMKHHLLKILVSLRLPEPLSYVMSITSWIYLTLFDPLFLRYGRIHEKVMV